MNYTREALLKKSISEFKDFKQNTLVYSTQQFITRSGFLYILKQPNPKSISCAIHYDRHWDSEWDKGKIETIEYEISSREYIEPESIIEYEGVQIAYVSYGSYNETMKQYTYKAISTYGYSNKFIILDQKEIEDNLAINSFPLLWDFFKSATTIPVFPSYLNVSRSLSLPDTRFISIDIPETRCVSILAEDLERREGLLVKSYRQNNNDKVKVAFVNLNQKDTYTLIAELKDFLTKSQDIGLVESMNIYPNEVYQKSFNIKSISNVCEFEVNYNLIIRPDEPGIKVIDIVKLLEPLIASPVEPKPSVDKISSSSVSMINRI